jgi:hypothetical protein
MLGVECLVGLDEPPEILLRDRARAPDCITQPFPNASALPLATILHCFLHLDV